MTLNEDVRQEVTAFFIKHAVGQTAADAFAPWWLCEKYQLAPSDAIARAPGGAHDFGLDAFHLERRGSDDPVLHLIQAKFSSSRQEIVKGAKNFARTMPQLGAILEAREVTGGTVSQLYTQLAAVLSRAVTDDSLDVSRLRLQFEILHLSGGPVESLNKSLDSAFEKFRDAAENAFPDHVTSIRLIELDRELEGRAYFGPSRSLISVEGDHPFRSMPIIHCGRSRSPVSVDADRSFRVKPITM